jgi:hypothetical protein
MIRFEAEDEMCGIYVTYILIPGHGFRNNVELV